MGCPKFVTYHTGNNTFPSALRVVKRAQEEKIIVVYWQVRVDEKGQILRVDCYVLNNPLKYTDPSGEILVPILVGAAIGVLTNGINNSVNGQAFFENAGRAALIGGISGAFSFGIGQAAAGMSGFGKVTFQTLAHGHLGGTMSSMNGGTYGQGFLSGAAGSLIASGSGALLKNAGAGWKTAGIIGSGALAGGVGAEIAGGNFWDGARNGAISAGLNHLAHSLQEVNPEKLKARILKDGRLTLKEANQWYRHGKGSPLTVDASKVDLDFINPDGWTVNQTKGVQTLYQSRDGRVYGNVTLTYKGGDQFKIHSDNYGFEMHTGSGASTWFRNQFTKIGGYVAGEGIGYDIHFNGYNTVNYSPYTPNYPTGYKW